MDGPPIPENIRIDAHGRLVQDLECVKCKYNLRTIHADAACPECGTAVGRSFLGNRLRYCNPKWLAGVWHGLNCLAGAAGCLMVLILPQSFIHADLMLAETWTYVMATTIATGLVLAVIGVWRASLPDPDRIEPESTVNGRRMARVFLTSTAAIFIVMLIVTAFIPWYNSARFSQIVESFVLLMVTTFILGLLAILWHARRLALRIPSRWLAGCTSAALLGVVLLIALLISMNHEIHMWVEHRVPRPLSAWIRHYYFDMLDYVEQALQWLLLGALGATAVLFIWYWLAMKKQASIARQTWAKPD